MVARQILSKVEQIVEVEMSSHQAEVIRDSFISVKESKADD